MGHAYSALFAASLAADEGGKFLLRIEDIDTSRCRKEYTEGIYEDLKWLGIRWESDVLIQCYQKKIRQKKRRRKLRNSSGSGT